jgi:hypothetical protein
MTRDSQGNNCELLGTGANLSDHAHVTRQTPLATKKKEMMNDPRYTTKAESDLDPRREAATTRARRAGNVRPLGGN